jgi:hypothetical protein
VRRCFRILKCGLTITLADITEEEFRVMELIEGARQDQISAEDGDAGSFQESLRRKLSRR